MIYVGKHGIEISFEDADDVDSCPLFGYMYTSDAAPGEPVAPEGNTEFAQSGPRSDPETHFYDNLYSGTLYELSVFSISVYEVPSEPAIIKQSTLKE